MDPLELATPLIDPISGLIDQIEVRQDLIRVDDGRVEVAIWEFDESAARFLEHSVRKAPRLTRDRTGLGVPNITSDSSVATIDPPHPSDRLVRKPCSSVFA